MGSIPVCPGARGLQARAPECHIPGMKRGEKRRRWTAAENRALRTLAAHNKKTGVERGNRDYPTGRLLQFARTHGRTIAAVLKRTERLAAETTTRATKA